MVTRNPSLLAALAALALANFSGGGALSDDAKGVPKSQAEQRLRLRVSWGYRSAALTEFPLRVHAVNAHIDEFRPDSLEDGDSVTGDRINTKSGNGDVDGVDLTIRFAASEVTILRDPQVIWSRLLAGADADTSRRLHADAGFRRDDRKLTFEITGAESRGFSLTVDQLLSEKTFWVPAFDLFVSAGDRPASFDEHQKALERWKGQRILDQTNAEPDASYEQFTRAWEDMGSERYYNPQSVHPGHIVTLAWDSSIQKFGIDRWGGVKSDLGNPNPFEFRLDCQPTGEGEASRPKNVRQSLTDGLPVIVTRFESGSVHLELEQFAFPLEGPPSDRRGDMPMVLLQRLRLRHDQDVERTLKLTLTLSRPWADEEPLLLLRTASDGLSCERPGSHDVVFHVRGEKLNSPSLTAAPRPPRRDVMNLLINIPPRSSRDLVVILPSSPVAGVLAERLRKLDYTQAREQTIRFWSDQLARGARFQVPEDAVNELFRANSWHALRLPRRHGGSGPGVVIDLPYSNFAYGQEGTPWPVNQAVYVDYMLHDLRGYHAISAEELATIFRGNQQPDGRVGGFANWGVYTPSMVYAVAQHGLLSGDRESLEALLPQALKALDWCLEQIRPAGASQGPSSGLLLAPLNDLSKEPRAWAFNQAYMFAAFDLFGRLLDEIGHPRAGECKQAARSVREAVAREFSRAATASPLVQLRDHTWTPFVPSDALVPRRLTEIWYPTDVDTGPLHLSRLRALDPSGPLTLAMLHDHEDNLFLGGLGMANEPVYNQQAAVYLCRDEVKPAIRAFYSMTACAFSQSVREPVEHRWGWKQYFGPPSTDGAWFELYRNMLISERDDQTLLLLQATPRRWLEDGKRIDIERAPTYFGPVSLSLESNAASGELRVHVTSPVRKPLKVLLVRLRNPDGKSLKSVTVNGRSWTDFDVKKEWVRISGPMERRYDISARY